MSFRLHQVVLSLVAPPTLGRHEAAPLPPRQQQGENVILAETVKSAREKF